MASAEMLREKGSGIVEVSGLARNWRLAVVRAMATIAFGFLALSVPSISLAARVILFGAFASVNGLPIVLETVGALEAQTARGQAEVIVVDRSGEATRRAIAERFPQAIVLAAEPHASIPELRRRGLVQARGEIVAVLEDHCVTRPDWLASIAESHARLPHAAIAGAVENGAMASRGDWAFYFCEYSSLGPPLAAGETRTIAGNCASYKRAALDAVGGFDLRWEGFLHQRLLAKGFRFYCEPRLSVVHKISFPLADMLRQRYHYSRSFAAMRVDGAPLSRRFAFALGSLALPPLVLARIVRDVLSKGIHRVELARAVPILVLLALAWAAGELVGYAAGPGGSVGEVR